MVFLKVSLTTGKHFNIPDCFGLGNVFAKGSKRLLSIMIHP